jgi:integrase
MVRAIGTEIVQIDTMEALAGWHTWLNASYAPETVDGYWGAAFRYLRAVPRPLNAHTEQDAAGWLETFSFRSASRTTYYNALDNLFSWALRNGIVTNNPMGAIRPRSPYEKVPRALTEAEYESVLTAAARRSPIRGYAVELLYYSAGRVSETCALRWEDLTEQGLVFRQTKNGKERLIPWSDGLMRAVEGLRAHFGEQPLVLPRAPQTVWGWLKDAGRDAGVVKVHPHLLRATAATRMLSRSTDDGNKVRPDAIQAVLGHSKITTTSRYWAFDRADVEAAVKLL